MVLAGNWIARLFSGRGRGTLACLAAGLSVAFGLSPAHAQRLEIYSFSDSATSEVDYVKPIARPRLDCKRMRSQTNFQFSVLTSELIAAEGNIPEHCRIIGLIDQDIKFDLSLPTAWNGRLYQRGSGGHGGFAITSHVYTQWRDNALARNFASLTATSGHDVGDPADSLKASTDASFAENNFAKHVDYAHRSVHLANRAARSLIETYYGRNPKRAYWDGCSTGGRQGHIAAQRFPDDFDGILAGAGVVDFEGIMMTVAWKNRAWAKTPIPFEKVSGVVRERVFAKCDGADGLEDGLLADPLSCAFDPLVDLPRCKPGADDRGCVTDQEARALKKIYDGPNIDGAFPYYGYPVGGEAEDYGGSDELPVASSMWERTLISPFHADVVDNFFKYLAFPVNDPSYDWKSSFAFTQENIDAFDRLKIEIMNATDPDLSAFREAGGKLISWHGWSDMSVPAGMSIRYHQRAKAEMGDALDDFYRLFLAPGVNHCGRGNGANKFDGMTALIEWVEAGIAPTSIHAVQTAGPLKGRTRLLCPHPEIGRYVRGDPNDAKSFRCEVR